VTGPTISPQTTRIRQRERDAIVRSLRAGVVPRIGHQHIQVGRAAEIRAVLTDLERLADGGASSRFVIGEYGSGKTFFLHVMRSIAMEKRLVTMHADLSPDRRMQATGGQARSLYAELTHSCATRARPEGGALPGVVERFVTMALTEARSTGADPQEVISDRLATLSELTSGYDFAEVIAAYWRGHDTGSDQLKTDAVRWLRGEFSTKADARRALGVRTIIGDSNVYDHLKLLSRFVPMAGYGGLLVCLDEMVNLYKLANTRARTANYEQLLRIVNDSMQGGAAHLGFLFSGTPDFLLDTRRGLYSYPALASRLAENTFAAGSGLIDLSGPVLRLGNLMPEDLYLLLSKLRQVFAGGDPSAYLVPDEALTAYMRHCAARIGDAYFRTPRETIKGFLDLLSLLEQNPALDWTTLIGTIDVTPDPALGDPTQASLSPDDPVDDELSAFRL
jgi:hypothetical protein